MQEIRKISIGPDYFNAMHVTVGKPILKGSATIHSIQSNSEETEFLVWIRSNEDSTVKHWKTYKNMPVAIEYNLDY